MGKSGKAQTVGYQYFMTLHMGLSRGPVDELVEVKVGDRTAWQGSATQSGFFPVHAPNLFGGEDSEGGISGHLAPLFGHDDQTPPDILIQHMAGPVPGFRRMMTAVFDGIITELNPYPKPWKFRLRRTTAGWEDNDPWYPEKAAIWLADNRIKAMNGVHILYECITNSEWGRGFSRAVMDDSTWRAAADTAYAEKLGLCLRWTRQDDLDTFIKGVVDQIGASVGVDRHTGLVRIKLMRADYDPNALPIYDYSSGLLSLQPGDVAPRDLVPNEVIVKWHEPAGDEEREIRAQNLAMIQSVGRKITKTVSYPGIPTADLAARMAERDLRIATSALVRYELLLDRRAWALFPGEVLRFSAPDRLIQNMILRIAEVEEQPDGKIRAAGVVDVFGLGATAFVADPGSGWVPPSLAPSEAAEILAREITYQEIAAGLTTIQQPQNLDRNSGGVLATAVRRKATDLSYRLASRVGAERFVLQNEDEWAAYAENAGPLGFYDTAIGLTAGSNFNLERAAGTAAQIGDEIIFIESLVADTSGGVTLTVRRGCSDTTPKEHPANTPIFFFYAGPASDNREYSRGEVVDTRIVSVALGGLMDVDSAPERKITIAGRQGRPLLPGRLRVDNQRALEGFRFGPSVKFTWANRNRLTQADKLVGHEDASIEPEANAVCFVTVFSAANGSEIVTSGPVTGTEVSFNTSAWPNQVQVHLAASVGSVESWERYVILGARN